MKIDKHELNALFELVDADLSSLLEMICHGETPFSAVRIDRPMGLVDYEISSKYGYCGRAYQGIADIWSIEGKGTVMIRSHLQRMIEKAGNAAVGGDTDPPPASGGKKSQLNDRMRNSLDEDPRRREWKASEWGRHLGCPPESVRRLPFWKSLQQEKEKAKQGRAGNKFGNEVIYDKDRKQLEDEENTFDL